jgi:hypothetical protein
MGIDGFEKREQGFETKYEREQDQGFRARARRDKAFGRWAAGLLQLDEAASEAYLKDVLAASFEEPGDEDILSKVEADLNAKGVGMSRGDLVANLDRCAQETAQEE